jgi:hypothetical protein
MLKKSASLSGRLRPRLRKAREFLGVGPYLSLDDVGWRENGNWRYYAITST